MAKESQKRTNRAALREASLSSTPASTIGWVATKPTALPAMRPQPVAVVLGDRAAGDAAKAGDDVLGERRADLEEVALVRDFEDQLLDVVGLVRVVGDQRV